MDCRRILICKNYVVFVALMILLVAGMLTWIASARLEAFHKYHLDIGNESIQGVDMQVSYFVEEKQRMVELFVHEQIDLVRALASKPNNDKIKEKFGELRNRIVPESWLNPFLQLRSAILLIIGRILEVRLTGTFSPYTLDAECTNM